MYYDMRLVIAVTVQCMAHTQMRCGRVQNVLWHIYQFNDTIALHVSSLGMLAQAAIIVGSCVMCTSGYKCRTFTSPN